MTCACETPANTILPSIILVAGIIIMTWLTWKAHKTLEKHGLLEDEKK